ncbi:twin-arginine translocase subunit TatC [Halorussus sp. MSC15.2]|uniref:twin-arginine translocase subunit TatC n=1 Tax=Halorussus sp. MSC15.2 TaxID=2283638 RepID=UPI0013CFF0C5|nr:twin-arginine translocase subunit TatC [Halorussus sp. MSC15.2]NEU55370.1 preprotein translocase subunit TatC [Halorussus sp. MSC15.2]
MSGTGSSIVDEDTARTVNSGRETVGAMLSTAQDHLQKVFIVFLVGFVASFYALRSVGWPFLKSVTKAQMPPSLAESVTIIAVTPFDVILLQAKIGAVAGIIIALPVLLYYSRDSLRQQSWYPGAPIARWKIALLVLLALGLFLGGMLYGYGVFFPLMFKFLANNAITAGFETRYSIVKWTEFIAFLSLSFGLAAELPLAMSGLGYTGIVPYETFRDKWRYAIMGIFVFGAVASPPDPFTQVMWATPLILLYGFSLYLTKIVVTLKRGSERLSFAGVIRDNWIRILGVPALAFLVVRMFFTRAGVETVNAELPSKYALPTVGEALGLPRTEAVLVASGAVALVAFVVAFLYYLTQALDEAASAAQAAGVGAPAAGAPSDIDLENLDAGAVRAAPPEVFADMSEEEAVGYARQAMDADDTEKAQAILDRYDELHPEDDEEGEADAAAGAAGAEAAAGADADGETTEATFPREESESSGNVLESTAAGMADAFTEDETTEDDIGGWFYDLRFIFESLTSKMMYLVAVFMIVLAAVFMFLYRGGIGIIRKDFLSRIPAEVRPETGSSGEILNIVTLHPVEALVFEVKISTLLAAVAVLPLLLYWAWPAMKERGLASGNRSVFGLWTGVIAVGLVAGSALGYTVVAPTIISWLVADAVRAEMIISYRVNNFFWLVFFTTAGIGLLADIPLTMWLFERGGIVSFDAMKDRWREVTIAIFAVAGLVTPDSLYTMFLIAIPISVAYLIGLGGLWVVTVGGRR